MKKIFAFIGVGRRNSATYEFTKAVLEGVKKERKIEYDIETNNTFPIECCMGCLNCFCKGTCPLDEKDYMHILKKKISECDFIILGSPVYLNHVSGSTKNFLDRLSYWSHIFKLRGKNGMVIATADASGTDVTVEYLKKALEYFGCVVVSKVEIIHLNNSRDLDVEPYIQDIVKSLDNPAPITDNIENMFAKIKKIILYKKTIGDKGAEIKYWSENGLFNANSLAELIKNEKANKSSEVL